MLLPHHLQLKTPTTPAHKGSLGKVQGIPSQSQHPHLAGEEAEAQKWAENISKSQPTPRQPNSQSWSPPMPVLSFPYHTVSKSSGHEESP